MPRIRCHYLDCGFLDEGYCSAASVEIDPDAGCKTYTPSVENISEDDWDEEVDMEEWEELDEEEDEEDLWMDENEDY